MKYYYISYCHTIGVGNNFLDSAIDEHPFDWLKKKGKERFKYSIVSFQEISKEEYDLYWE